MNIAGASHSQLIVCDDDGSVLAENTQPGFGQGEMNWLGIGQLDRDPAREIVAAGPRLVSFEQDLSLRWRLSSGDGPFTAFLLVDLDGDCVHEIVAQTDHSVMVVSGAGEVLFTLDLGEWPGHWTPRFADVDGDGLAELFLELGWVLDNDEGGWPIPPGVNRYWGALNAYYPNLRASDGSIPAPEDVFWNKPNQNGWNAIPLGLPR